MLNERLGEDTAQKVIGYMRLAKTLRISEKDIGDANGAYIARNNEIVLNSNRRWDSSTVVHELVHSLTQIVIENENLEPITTFVNNLIQEGKNEQRATRGDSQGEPTQSSEIRMERGGNQRDSSGNSTLDGRGEENRLGATDRVRRDSDGALRSDGNVQSNTQENGVQDGHIQRLGLPRVGDVLYGQESTRNSSSTETGNSGGLSVSNRREGRQTRENLNKHKKELKNKIIGNPKLTGQQKTEKILEILSQYKDSPELLEELLSDKLIAHEVVSYLAQENGKHKALKEYIEKVTGLFSTAENEIYGRENETLREEENESIEKRETKEEVTKKEIQKNIEDSMDPKKDVIASINKTLKNSFVNKLM